MIKKIEELLPKILRDLSNGIAISTVEIKNTYGFSASGVRNHLRTLEQNFYKNCYRYDGSQKKWVVIEMGFLNKMLLKPEEVIILNAMKRNPSRLGNGLSKWHKDMVNNYIKRTSSFIFKQHIAEDITEDMEQIFAVIHSAVDDSKKIRFKFNDEQRVVLPYKIINIEYYWYLLGFEESCDNQNTETQKPKSFAISKIYALELLEDKFKYDFSEVENRLEHIMNAWVSFDKPTIIVELLVLDEFTEYVDRASFFSAWRKTDYMTEIKEKNYVRYEVKTTNPEFMDITPTIMKYLPNILVEEPIELKEKIDSLIDKYKEVYN